MNKIRFIALSCAGVAAVGYWGLSRTPARLIADATGLRDSVNEPANPDGKTMTVDEAKAQADGAAQRREKERAQRAQEQAELRSLKGSEDYTAFVVKDYKKQTQDLRKELDAKLTLQEPMEAEALMGYADKIRAWAKDNDHVTERATILGGILKGLDFGDTGRDHVRLLGATYHLCHSVADGYYMNEPGGQGARYHRGCVLADDGKGLICYPHGDAKLYMDPTSLHKGPDSLYGYLKRIDSDLNRIEVSPPEQSAAAKKAVHLQIETLKKAVAQGYDCVLAGMKRVLDDSAGKAAR